MATIGLIKECILALGDRTGSSIPAMNKWIESEKSVSKPTVSLEEESNLAGSLNHAGPLVENSCHLRPTSKHSPPLHLRMCPSLHR